MLLHVHVCVLVLGQLVNRHFPVKTSSVGLPAYCGGYRQVGRCALRLLVALHCDNSFPYKYCRTSEVWWAYASIATPCRLAGTWRYFKLAF